jgi:hypothetical protein
MVQELLQMAERRRGSNGYYAGPIEVFFTGVDCQYHKILRDFTILHNAELHRRDLS